MAEYSKGSSIKLLDSEPTTDAPPPAAQATPLSPEDEYTVGFTCAFVNSPKELRTECPICLYILREPYQATCCGCIYCMECIDHVKKDLKPCPTCRELNFDIFPDRGLRNALYGFKVHCNYKEKGCTWSGELRHLDNHLNLGRKPERRFFGCEYVEERCSMCGSVFPRGNLEQHEMKSCPSRPYTCEYCSNHSATFEQVAENHWPVCPLRPVPCPNECGIYPIKKDLEYHLRNDCELRNREPGPEAASPLPSDVYKHIESTVKNQLASMVPEFLKRALQEELGRELVVVGELQEAVDRLKLVKEESQKLRAELQLLQVQQQENHKAIEILKSHSSIVPLKFTLDDYASRHTRKEMGWYSPAFYTHARGYHMCLLVDVGGPAGQAKGVFLSVFLNITKGDYDSHLSWPFRGKVVITLLNQGADKSEDHVEVIRYHETTPVATSGRVREEGKMSKPWGKGRFIRHDELVSKGFVMNNELKFEISKVIFDEQQQQQQI